MREHAVTVAGRRVSVAGPICVSGSAGADAIVPTFDAEWDEMSEVHAMFSSGILSVEAAWDGQSAIEVPSAVLGKPGFVGLSFWGSDGAGQVLNTVACPRAICVSAGGPVSASGAVDVDYASDDEVEEAFEEGYDG